MPTDSFKRSVLTLFIVTILGFQALTSVTKFVFKPVRFSKLTWPMISYDMYSKSHQDGEHLEVTYIVFATMNSGEDKEITKEALGMRFWDFYKTALGLLGNNSDKFAQIIIKSHPRGSDFTELKVYTSPYIVTKDGIKDASPEIILSKTLRSNHKEVNE